MARTVALAALLLAAPALPQGAAFVNWESPQTHPVDVTPNGQVLVAVNTPDARLEVFDLVDGVPSARGSVPVGLDPVSVRVRGNGEAWVVNQISDSVSVVDLATLRVTRTIAIGDEPADLVFAGSPQKAFVTLNVAEKVAVVDAAAPGTVTTVAIAGSAPRSMAASPDGTKVYVAIFESGNHSTMVPRATVSAANGPYAGQNPPPNAGSAFSPPMAAGLDAAPTVSHIVKKNALNRWLDGNGRDWTGLVTWDVHDHDIAVINASSNAVSYVNGLMTIVAGLGAAPNGDLLAVGLDSRNELRFQQNIRSVFARCVGARVAGGTTAGAAFDLNPHLDYTQPSTSQANRTLSIGDPRGVAFSPAGTVAYVAGLGSNSVIALNPTNGTRLATIPVGEGPTGLAMHPAGPYLYVLNRFEGSLSTVVTGTHTEIARVALHDPTPGTVKAGRRFLYDTHETSGLGQLSCATCHVDGRSDRIAWDLGNPQGSVKIFDQTCQVPGCISWHPMKGPLTTQTLVGIVGTEPFHWRGEKVNLSEFNEAYVELQGRDSQITASEMASLQDYVASLTFGPNPYRNVDNSLKTSLPIVGGGPVGNGGTGNPSAAQTVFNTAAIFGAPPGLTCLSCHAGTPGTNRRVDIPGIGDSQNRKNAPLRDVYRKVGASKASAVANRGFGFDHAGDDATLQDVLSVGFRWPAGATGLQQRRDMEALLLSFGTDTHAGAGQQVTVANGGTGDNITLLNQLVTVATTQSTQVGLIAKGVRNGEARGWLLQGGSWTADRSGETATTATLIASATAGAETTFTLVPAGMARRLGVDRDGDGALDGDELAAGTDPANARSYPGACTSDLDGSGSVDGGDLAIAVLDYGPCLACPSDLDGNGEVGFSDLAILLLDFGPCP